MWGRQMPCLVMQSFMKAMVFEQSVKKWGEEDIPGWERPEQSRWVARVNHCERCAVETGWGGRLRRTLDGRPML